MARSLNERVADLEEEVKVIKGTIKKLVMDIREILNNMENPFHGSKIPTVPENKIEKENSSPTPSISPQSNTPDTKSSQNETLNQSGQNQEFQKEYMQQPKTEQLTPNQLNQESQKWPTQQPIMQQSRARYEREFKEEDSVIKASKKFEKEKKKEKREQKIDLVTLTKLMQWAEHMLSRIGKDKFKDVLDFYVLTGYLPKELKKLMLIVAEFSGSVPGESDVMIDLYRLNKILNPEDKEMDSAILSMILDDSKSGWLKILQDEGEKLTNIIKGKEKKNV